MEEGKNEETQNEEMIVQEIPTLTKICSCEFAKLIGENNIVISKIFPTLPTQIIMLILQELPPDSMFFYYVICSDIQFDVIPWKTFFKTKYIEEMKKIKEQNIELVDQIGSWHTKHALPLLPIKLNDFYVDIENDISTNNFKKYFLELKKMVKLMRETRKLNSTSTVIVNNNNNNNMIKEEEEEDDDDNNNNNNNSKTNKNNNNDDGKNRRNNNSNFSQSNRGLLLVNKNDKKNSNTSKITKKNKSPMKKKKKGNNIKKKNLINSSVSSSLNNKNKMKKKKSNKTTMIKQLFDPGFLMVPSCFGCDSSNVSLDFFFPHQNILNSINSWGGNLQRPPYLNSLCELNLRGATLSDSLIKRICKQHPLIESLDLMSKETQNVSKKSLFAIATLVKLKKLNIGLWKENIFQLENVKMFIALISEECKRALDPRKKSAAKSTMREIREDMVIYAPPLLYLSLEQTLIKDNALNYFLRECPRLIDVNLSGCLYLTNKCLFGLSNPDLRIERLNHCGCYKLSNEGFSRPLLSVHPDIIFYNNSNLFAANYEVSSTL